VLTCSCADSIAVVVQAAEAALDDAIANNDAAAIASCARRLRGLQGTASRGYSFERSSVPGTAVERDIAEALEQAALDAGDDVDNVGLLDELQMSDLPTRVSLSSRAHTRICAYTHTHAHTHTHTHTCVCAYKSVYVYTYIYIYICIKIYICINIYISIYIHKYVCIYVCICL